MCVFLHLEVSSVLDAIFLKEIATTLCLCNRKDVPFRYNPPPPHTHTHTHMSHRMASIVPTSSEAHLLQQHLLFGGVQHKLIEAWVGRRVECPQRLRGPLDSEHAQEVDLLRHKCEEIRHERLHQDISSVCVQYRIVVLKQTGKGQCVCAVSD